MRFIPRWRKMTWVIVIFTLLMIIWAVGAGSSSGDNQSLKDCLRENVLSDQACRDANDVGTGIGLALLFVLWFIGFIVLSIVWLMTRPKNRTCPVCGNDVKKGMSVCKNCGYDFATTRPGYTTAGQARFDPQTGERLPEAPANTPIGEQPIFDTQTGERLREAPANTPTGEQPTFDTQTGERLADPPPTAPPRE